GVKVLPCAAAAMTKLQRADRNKRMNVDGTRLGKRDQQITQLLLQGCDNADIAKQLNMARRTVKARLNRLFVRFGITTGIKRVKLATLLYRRQLCLQSSATEHERPVNESTESSSSLPKASRTKRSPMSLEPQNMSSKTIFGSSTTNSGFGTELNSPCGTKPAASSTAPTPDLGPILRQ